MRKTKELKNQRTKKLFLTLILILAAILRLWGLDQYPAGLNADEAAIGYNAHSLLLTGRDEHGNAWPIHFKSFGDYKPGFYFYLVLPLVKFLGLNIWAIRLPSAILGILSVFLIFLLTKELFRNKSLAIDYSLLASLLLAISPWHLHFSRGGWEANAGTFFILTGVYFFLRALNQSKYFVVCCLLFVVSLYTYHSARVVVPLLGLGLTVLYRQKIFQRERFKWIFVTLLLGVFLLAPLVISFFGPAGASRFSGVGLLADTGPWSRINELRGQHHDLMALPVRLVHNRFLAYGLAFVENWLDHFHGEFLFLSGDVIERSRVPETGQLYLLEIPFVIFGAYFLLRKKPGNWQVIFLWLAVAPVAAAMTFQTPHALRAHNMVIPLTVISTYGAYKVFIWLKSNLFRRFFYVVCCLSFVVCFWNFARYLRQYYVHYPKTYPFAWEEGFEELVNYVVQVEDQYEKILVTDRYDQPYILFLFYLHYPPEKFQQEVRLTPKDKFGFSTVRHFDKFYFGKIDWKMAREERNALIIGTDEEIPDSVEILKVVRFRNNKPAFLVSKS